MTRYEKFEELQALTRMEKTGEYSWNKMIQTGSLSLHDYRTGYIDLSIYYLLQSQKHYCRITIDDGDFGSWNEFDTAKEAKELVDKAVNFFNDMIIFPTDEELNEELRPLGIYVTYE